eukprot:scaffold14076_cov87-Isochrysis_galbana.AAC.1
MSIGTPSTSIPCSTPLGSSSPPTHPLSAATPAPASEAQMPSITRPPRARAAAQSERTAAARASRSSPRDHALAVSAPPRPLLPGAAAAAREKRTHILAGFTLRPGTGSRSAAADAIRIHSAIRHVSRTTALQMRRRCSSPRRGLYGFAISLTKGGLLLTTMKVLGGGTRPTAV